MVYIYKLYFEHLPNECYIGQTNDMSKRLCAHRAAARSGVKFKVSEWIAKNGINKVKHEILVCGELDGNFEEKNQVNIHKSKGFSLLNVKLMKDNVIGSPKRSEKGRTDKLSSIILFLESEDFDGLREYLKNDILYNTIVDSYKYQSHNHLQLGGEDCYFFCQPFNIESLNKVKEIASKFGSILEFTFKVDYIFSQTNVLVTSIFNED